MDSNQKQAPVPHAPDAERAVICCLMLNPELIAQANAEGINQELFFDTANRRLFQLIMELNNGDVTLLTEHIRHRKDPSLTVADIGEIFLQEHDPANWEKYIGILRDRQKSRQGMKPMQAVPQNEIAEKAVLCALLNGLTTPSKLEAEGITKDVFHCHKRAFVEVSAFAKNGGGEVLEFVQDAIQKGYIDEIGTAGFVMECAGLYPAEHIQTALPKYLTDLKKCHAQRQIQQASQRLAVDPTSLSALDEITAAQAALAKVEAGQSKRRPLVSGVSCFPTNPEAETILAGDGAIRIGDIVFLNSGAGMGKSVAMAQLAMSWGLGLPCFGITPSRALRILHYVGEDDDATMGQIREGFLIHSEAITGHQLKTSDLDHLDEMIATQFDRSATGDGFLVALRHEIEAFRPDIVFINPLLSYIGGEIVATAPLFLRAGIMPLLTEYKCAAFIAHHTCKLNRDSWDTMDMAYSGIGGSELANIPRSVLTLAPAGDDGLIRLNAAKRTTYGWKNENGKHMSHAYFRRTDDPTRPAWLPVSYDDAESAIGDNKAAKSAASKKVSIGDILEILRTGDTQKRRVIELLMQTCKASDKTCETAIRNAISSCAIAEYDEQPTGKHRGSPVKWLTLKS